DVKDFTIEWLDKLLRENKIKFIKWDMNRYIAEAGWPDADPAMQRELRIRYIDNLYYILKTIREKHPTVVFETCSGGGGRSNYGMLQYTDQIWTSDNTNVGDRLQIQYGFSHAFPAKVMVNWVTDEAWYGENPSLRFRLLVSMAGNLGIGSNLHLWNDKDKAIAREMIALYKEIRPIIQFGDVYRIGDPLSEDRCAFQYVSRDRSHSVLFVYQTQPSIRDAVSGSRCIVLHGLDLDAEYQVFGDIETEIARGKTLLSGGLSVPLQGSWDGKLIRLEKTTADQEEKQ
ncbi:MAG: alpha-galactosidase, partial [Calditrichaeota bacterium]